MRKYEILIYSESESKLDYYADLSVKTGEKNKINCTVRRYENGNQMLFEVEDLLKMKLIDVIIIDGDDFLLANEIKKLGYKGNILFILYSSKYKIKFEDENFHFIRAGKDYICHFEWEFMEAIWHAKKSKDRYIVVSRAGEYKQIVVHEIFYFQVRDHVVEVLHESGAFEFISTLAKIESDLYEQGFIRIHRSFIVAVQAIKRISYKVVIMKNGDALPVGRKYYGSLKLTMVDLGKQAK